MGQVMGTSVGTQVFTKYGWRPSAALSLAWTGFMLFMMLIRGPHVSRYTWFGYEGGIEVRKSKLAERERAREEDAEAAVAANEAGSADVEETRSAHKEPRGDVEAVQDKGEKDRTENEERPANTAELS